MPADTTLPFSVETIHEPKELSCLNGERVNLDELNYLAKRLDSFVGDELLQFYLAVEKTGAKSLKDIINLTFNTDKFTLITNVGNMTDVGKDYTLNTEGAIPADSKYDDKYAEIGRNLLGSGKGVFTEYGLLFIEDKPIEEFYDGQVFPPYYYSPSIIDLTLEYNGKIEMVYLPDSDLAAQKAVHRLGAESIDDCKCVCEVENPKYEYLEIRFEEIMHYEGIEALNAVCRTVDEQRADGKKLYATLELTGASTSKDMLVLVNRLNEFELITDISDGDYESVGRYFIENSDDYVLSEDLYDYFDFYEFGKEMANTYSGMFTGTGYISCITADGLNSIRNEFEDESSPMTIGGM